MGNKMIVENFIHNCEEKKVEYSKHKKEIVNIYNTNEIKKIYLTYLNEFEETKVKYMKNIVGKELVANVG